MIFFKKRTKPRYRIVKNEGDIFAQVQHPHSTTWKHIHLDKNDGKVYTFSVDSSFWEEDCVCESIEEAELLIQEYRIHDKEMEFKILKEYEE